MKRFQMGAIAAMHLSSESFGRIARHSPAAAKRAEDEPNICISRPGRAALARVQGGTPFPGYTPPSCACNQLWSQKRTFGASVTLELFIYFESFTAVSALAAEMPSIIWKTPWQWMYHAEKKSPANV